MSELPMAKVLPLIRAAYAEDLGDAGDITTMSTIPEGTQATAHLRRVRMAWSQACRWRWPACGRLIAISG